MTREEVYGKCSQKQYFSSMKDHEEAFTISKMLLPPEAIDAIIDCAVEEAVKAMKEGIKNVRSNNG